MKITKYYIYAIAFAFVFSSAAFAAETAARESQAMRIGFDHNFRASELMNKDIHNARGEKIGEVSDLVIDESGQVRQIVIGGVDSLVLPFDSSDFTIQENAIIARNFEGERLGDASLADADWYSEDTGVRGYYEEGFTEDPGITTQEEDERRPLGYPLDRHPQLDVWHPPAGHPPYGAAD